MTVDVFIIYVYLDMCDTWHGLKEFILKSQDHFNLCVSIQCNVGAFEKLIEKLGNIPSSFMLPV